MKNISSKLKRHCFKFLHISLTSGLIEVIFSYPLLYSVCCYMYLEKGRNILVAFSGRCGYSLLYTETQQVVIS